MRRIHNRYRAIRLPLLPVNVVVIHAYEAHDLIPGFFIRFGGVDGGTPEACVAPEYVSSGFGHPARSSSFRVRIGVS